MNGMMFIWSSSNQNIATINNGGLASGLAAGTSNSEPQPRGEQQRRLIDSEQTCLGIDLYHRLAGYRFDSGRKHTSI